jgi:RNA polymerase sigma factor (sigma-70 family)
METTTSAIGRFAARRLGDAGLFERAGRGDANAFSEVYRRYQKRVYGFCLARSGSPEIAADATQEVFLRLLHSGPDDVRNASAWLFTVAKNVVIDAARKRARLAESGEVDEDSPAWASLAAADTADEVLGRAEGKDVFLALRSLSVRHRTALILREIHGQSSKEMAEAFGSTPGAVDTLVSRARDAFGVAYAVAAELPPACRSGVELIYRKRGSGLTATEEASLDAHLAGCERCRAEAKKADDPRHLAALLPFLVPSGAAGGLLRRLALAGHSVTGAATQAGATVASQPHTWNLASKVAAGLLVATVVAAPIAGTLSHRSPAAATHAPAAAMEAPAAAAPASLGRLAASAGMPVAPGHRSHGSSRGMGAATMGSAHNSGSGASGSMAAAGGGKPATGHMAPSSAGRTRRVGARMGRTAHADGRGAMASSRVPSAQAGSGMH